MLLSLESVSDVKSNKDKSVERQFLGGDGLDRPVPCNPGQPKLSSLELLVDHPGRR